MNLQRPILSGPQFINWNYTYRCNFRCDHCYSRASSYPAELTTEQYVQVAAQIIDAQVFYVALGGGEVLLREDCTLILSKLARAGIVTMLTTNGWFLDSSWAARLRDAGLAELWVSLDSPDPTVHDSFRNRSGSFDRVIQCLSAATAAGLTVYLSVVLSQINQSAISELVAVAVQHGLRGANFKRYRPSGNGLRNRDRYELKDADGPMIGEEVGRLGRETGLNLTLNFGPEAGPVDAGCGCGVASLALRPNGDLVPCVYGEAVLGNLTEHTLADLWRNSPQLHAMRTAGGCIGRRAAPAPSNPQQTSNQLLELGLI